MRRIPWGNRRVRNLCAGVAIGGILLALVAPRAGWPLAGAGFLGLLLTGVTRIEQTVTEARREILAMVQLRPLLGDLPVEVGGWAMEALLLQEVVRLVVETRPGLILECGSGSSTVVLARCLRALGHGRIVSLDHDPGFARATTDLLRLHGVDDIATCVVAPLGERRAADGRTLRWYAAGYEPLLTEPVELLLVDGPPRGSGTLARYPALVLLRPYLSPRCIVLLDDGDRPDERAIAQAWGRELEVKPTYLRGGRGGWLLRARC
jgi:hypothetical protein